MDGNRNKCIFHLLASISYNPLMWPRWFAISYVSNHFKSIFSRQQNFLLPRDAATSGISPTDQHCGLNTALCQEVASKRVRGATPTRSVVNLQGVPGMQSLTARAHTHHTVPITQVLLHWCKQEIFSQRQQCCLTCLVKLRFGLVLVLGIL